MHVCMRMHACTYIERLEAGELADGFGEERESNAALDVERVQLA